MRSLQDDLPPAGLTTTTTTTAKHPTTMRESTATLEPPDPNNLEGKPLTDEERKANAKALSELHVGNRFRLMFGMSLLLEKPTLDRYKP